MNKYYYILYNNIRLQILPLNSFWKESKTTNIILYQLKLRPCMYIDVSH